MFSGSLFFPGVSSKSDLQITEPPNSISEEGKVLVKEEETNELKERLYACCFCDKRFSLKKSCEEHEATHTEEGQKRLDGMWC